MPAERRNDNRLAISRETTIKSWPRAWKISLIAQMNPAWNDLYELLTAGT